VDFANDGGDGGFTGGFSAFGGDLTINIGGALAENVWNRQWTFGQRTGARQFYTSDAVMVMNSIYSDGMVNWQNPLALGGALGSAVAGNAGVTHDSNMIREIRVNDNPVSVTDFGRYSGVIRDGNNAVVTNNGIRKSGTGLLELTALNTYTGTTFVDAGTLAAVNTTALGTAASGTTVASGATLDVRANIGSEAITVGGTGVGGAGALITATTLTGTVGGTVTLTGATSIGGAGTGILNINGVVTTGGNPLTTLGTGETTFGAASTLTSVASLAVTDGTTNVNSALGTAGNAVVAVSDTVGGVATKLRFGTVSQTLGSLTIGAGATVVFTSGLASGSLTGDDGGGKAAGFGSPASSFGGGATVPEPGTLGLLLVGALGMLNRRRRQA
jgi:autotransporter-associated beta strand protein